MAPIGDIHFDERWIPGGEEASMRYTHTSLLYNCTALFYSVYYCYRYLGLYDDVFLFYKLELYDRVTAGSHFPLGKRVRCAKEAPLPAQTTHDAWDISRRSRHFGPCDDCETRGGTVKPQ